LRRAARPVSTHHWPTCARSPLAAVVRVLVTFDVGVVLDGSLRELHLSRGERQDLWLNLALVVLAAVAA
jgi:hypothetical protein